MFAVRRAVARVPARSVLRRGYADVADDKLKLSLVMPHKVSAERKDEIRVALQEKNHRRVKVGSFHI
jgi:hypothetical protein